MELRKLDAFLLKLLLLSAAGIIITQALGLESLTSVLFLMTFPLTVLLWMCSVRKTITGTDLLMLATVLIAVVCVLHNLRISGGSLSFSYIKKLVMFIMTLLFLQTAYRMRVGKDMVRFVDWLADFLAIFLIYEYFADRNSMYMLNGYVTRFLTFRFSNPNTTGMFLTCLYMLEVYRLFTRERWYWKLLHIVMAGMLGWFVLLTQSRNCLLVLVLFTMFSAWLEFRSRRKLRITKTWARIIAWFPLIFVASYMALVYVPWIQKMLAFLVDAGKSLDSRVQIWTQALEYIWASPLVGDFYGISGGTGYAQLHNSHLDIAASYGIPVLILVCILLRKYLYRNGRYYNDKESYCYMMGFACAVMLGMGEAALFSGGLGIYIFIGMFLMLSGEETVG